LALLRFGRPPAPFVAASATLAVIALGLSWYYLARYRTNSEYLLRRNFRVLAITGRQLQVAVGDVAGLLDAHVQEVGRWKTSQPGPAAQPETAVQPSAAAQPGSTVQPQLIDEPEVSSQARPPRGWA
jgi:hypothetical protein